MRAWLERQLGRIKIRSNPQLLLLIVVAVVALVPVAAHADIIGWLWNVIANIFLFFTKLLGYLLILLVKILIQLAQYSNFVAPGPSAVQVGWVVVRDLVNMFFIFILLIMAFAIILGVEKYGNPKTVRDLFIMAVIVNFSKTISGIFIDLGQVVMLTFVNGFAQAAGGNFLNAFQINKILQLRAEGQLQGSGLAMVAALAFIMVAVAVCVIIVMVIQMAFRIVMLWILIILSPLAFLGRAFEPMKKDTYDRWWSMFKDYITKGPIIAFFLWLALLSAQKTGGNLTLEPGFTKKSASDAEITQQESNFQIASEAAKTDAILSMIIVVCILIGGLKIAGEGGNLGAGASKWMANKAQQGMRAAKDFSYRNTVGRAKDVGGAGLRTAQSLALRGGGGALSRVTGGRLGAGLSAKGRQIQQEQKDARKKFTERLTGTAVDRAITNPKGFGRELASEKNPAKQLEMAKALSDPKVAGAISKDPRSVGEVASALDTARKTNPALDKTYNDFIKQNWKSEDNRGRTRKTKEYYVDEESGKVKKRKVTEEVGQELGYGLSREQREEALKSFGADDAAKMTADDIASTGDQFSSMSGAAFNQLMNKGTAEQKGAMNQMMGFQGGDIGKLLDKKKVAVEAVGADLMRSKPEAAQYVLDKTRNNQEARAELAQNPDKASALADHISTSLSGALSNLAAFDNRPGDLNNLVIDSITTGTLDASQMDAKTPLMSKLGGVMDPSKFLRGIDENNPRQMSAASAAFGALKQQNPSRYNNVMKNENYLRFRGGGDGGVSTAAVEQAVGKVAQALEGAAQKIQTGAGQVSENLTSAGEEIGRAGEEAGEEVGKAGTEVAKKFEQGGQDVKKATEEAARKIKGAGDGAKKS